MNPVFGRLLFGLGVAGLGLQALLLGEFPPELAPVPALLDKQAFCASVIGLLLLGTGIGICANRQLRLCACILALVGLAGLAFTHVSRLLGDPTNVGAWVGAFELLTLTATALVLAATSPDIRGIAPIWNKWIDHTAIPALACIGLACVIFGTVHFMYAQAIASLIPTWIPGALAWAYVIGIARVVAGVALVIYRSRRLSAGLLATMYGTWVLVLHVPRLAASEGSSHEWTFTLLAITFCGGAWLIAAPSSKREPSGVGEVRLAV
jgi:hypothetical protein